MTIIQVKVKPRARNSALTRIADGSYVAELRAAPVDGKANDELLALIAGHFGVPRAAVSIKTGASARIKRVQIDTGER